MRAALRHRLHIYFSTTFYGYPAPPAEAAPHIRYAVNSPYLATFARAYLGFPVALVPPVFDIWQTAAVPASLIFSLIGTVFMFPILIGYTIFIYWIFRGKIKEGEGYH